MRVPSRTSQSFAPENEDESNEQSSQAATPSIALRVLAALIALLTVAAAAVGLVGLAAFVVPTLSGAAPIYETGRVSGVPVPDGQLRAPEATNTAERLDLPGTDNLGRLVIEAPGATVETNAALLPARMVYDNAPLTLRLTVVAADAARYFLAVAALAVIWRLAGTARQGNPFAASSARRLRTLGVIAFATWATTPVFDAIRAEARPPAPDIVGHTFLIESTTNYTWIAVAVALFALGEIFAHGRALQISDDDTI